MPIPRRTPVEITQAVRESLLDTPNFCDAWHAERLQVLETVVSRIRSQLGIPKVKRRELGVFERRNSKAEGL